MTKKFSLFLMLALVVSVFHVNAQAPEKFNYQAIARNSTGAVLQNQFISIRLTVHDSSQTGQIVYQETDTATTNAFGLFTVEIGGGLVVQDSFTGINWGNNAKYLQVESDPTGGSNYTDMGSSQLLSVPYALYAANGPVSPAPNHINGAPDRLAKFFANDSVGGSNVFDSINVGISTLTPAEKLEVNGNIRLSSGADRVISVSDVQNDVSANSLTIMAGSTSNDNYAQNGGSLYLAAGSQYNESYNSYTGGNVVITSGGNSSACNDCTDGGYIAFQTGGPNNSVNEQMRVLPNGYVGIGTASPSNMLQVAGTTATAALQVSDSGTLLTNIETGTAVLGSTSTAGVNTFAVNFPQAFASPPKVIVTAHSTANGLSDTFVATTVNITNTGFNVNIYRIDNGGGTWGQNLELDWQASTP